MLKPVYEHSLPLTLEVSTQRSQTTKVELTLSEQQILQAIDEYVKRKMNYEVQDARVKNKAEGFDYKYLLFAEDEQTTIAGARPNVEFTCKVQMTLTEVK